MNRKLSISVLFVFLAGLLAFSAVFGGEAGTAEAAPRRPRRTPTPTPTRLPVASPTPTGSPAPSATPGLGGSWQVVDSPNVTDKNNRLNAIAAVAANDQWAVGEYSNPNGTGKQTLIQHWDGNAWTIVASPNPDPSSSSLYGVAAISANEAWAVGRTGGVTGPNWKALILHWNGASWSSVPAPDTGQGTSDLRGVAGLSANDVWAVGAISGPATNWWEQTLILHWDGSAWSIVPSPRFGTSSFLSGIAVLAPDNVWAVGYSLSTDWFPFILHWNGSTWNTVSAPSGLAGRLYAVAAVSANDVWAVGIRKNATTLVLRWNGSSWSAVPSPNGVYAGSNQHTLNSLTVLSANDIWAVGASASSGLCGGSDSPDYRSYSLALHWNGSVWEQVQTANPSPRSGCNTPRNDFYGVAGAGGQVFAVGAFYNPDLSVQRFRTLIEQSP